MKPAGRPASQPSSLPACFSLLQCSGYSKAYLCKRLDCNMYIYIYIRSSCRSSISASTSDAATCPSPPRILRSGFVPQHAKPRPACFPGLWLSCSVTSCLSWVYLGMHHARLAAPGPTGPRGRRQHKPMWTRVRNIQKMGRNLLH